MIRTTSYLLFALLISACSNPDSLPNKVERKVEQHAVRVGDKIENAGQKVEHKVQKVGETLEGNN